MPPKQLFQKYGAKNKKTAARAAVAAARATIIASRRSVGAPPGGPRGFYGSYNRPGGTELKVLDVAPTSVNMSTGMSFALLNGIAQGDDYNTRDGRKINMKSIHLIMTLRNRNDVTGATYAQGDMVRVVLFMDRQANGVDPTAVQLYDTDSLHSQLKLDNRERFTILKEWKLTLNGMANTGASGTLVAGAPKTYFLKKYLRLNTDVVYQGTGATIASIATNSLYIGYQSAVGGLGYLTFSSRIRFTE